MVNNVLAHSAWAWKDQGAVAQTTRGTACPFAMAQMAPLRPELRCDMAAFLYRCPATGMKVQAWFADDASANEGLVSYDTVTCLACRRLHLVSPVTGRVLGGDGE